VTAERAAARVATAALVAHVRLFAAVRLRVNSQLVRRQEQFAADGARVRRLTADAMFPEVTLERVLPEELLGADAALVAELVRVDSHVDAEVRHVVEATAAFGTNEFLLGRVCPDVRSQRHGRREVAATVTAHM